MADTKITALTAIGANPIIPSTFPIPMVDLTDTSMAASGTTKKVTVNQILGAGGTATLASATITGDLTVDTSTLKVDSANNRVGVVTATPRVSLDVASGDIYSSGQITWGGSSPTANQGFLSFTGGNAVIGSTGATALLFYTNGVERYNIGSTGISTWSNVGGVAGTAMTLNSTGLGVGKVPASNQSKVQIYQALGTSLNGALHITDDATTSFVFNNTSSGVSSIWTSGALTFSTGSNAYSTNGARMTLDASGNLLVGTASGLYRGQFAVTSGADRSIFAAQVTGASNGLQVQWNHATTTLRVILANIPTSSAGLASGTLWNDAGTIKIV